MILLMLGAAMLLAWGWASLRQEALASAAYAARVGCVCHFVSGQEPAQCKGDVTMAGLGRTADMVMLSADDAAGTLTARVPLLASQSATFRRETGCQLEPWGD